MLYIWDKILQDQCVQELLYAKDSDACFEKALKALIPFAEHTAVTGHVVQEYIIRKMVQDENFFTDSCRKDAQYGTVTQVALQDICYFQEHFFNFDWEARALKCCGWSFKKYKAVNATRDLIEGYDESITGLVAQKDPKALLKGIIRHIESFGTGELSQFSALKWSKGRLWGIRNSDVDAIHFNQLVEIAHQKETIIKNTRAFLSGQPANHILLCGSMGSGKSSCVKALLSYFAQDKLRIIDVPKRELDNLDVLMRAIKNKNAKYILFLDDLSFEGDDLHYKQLKVALDGQLEKKPDNLLVYATSNRRNLVRDTWADREGGEDVHENDTLNEKYSLAERFGIKLFFTSYDQNEYLSIVEAMFASHQMLFTEEIRKKALVWERDYHGRSGRTARNFVMQYLPEKKKHMKDREQASHA